MLIFNYIFFIGYVPTASMEPAIREGSLIFGIRAFPGLKRGDVVVFRHDGMLLVKRIEGAPGDIVDAADGRSAVPGGRYYMLGDNEENSVDSRCWDEPFVPSEEIIALIRAG
jgi:signal peptidase I